MKNIFITLMILFITLSLSLLNERKISKPLTRTDSVGILCLDQIDFQQIFKLSYSSSEQEIARIIQQFDLLKAQIVLDYSRNTLGEIDSMYIDLNGISCRSYDFGKGYIILNRDGTGVCTIQKRT